jgi:hypothetical protein
MLLFDAYLSKYDLITSRVQLYGFLCFRLALNRWKPTPNQYITYDIIRDYMATDVQTLPDIEIDHVDLALRQCLPKGWTKVYDMDAKQYRMSYAATFYSPVYRLFEKATYKRMIRTKTNITDALFNTKFGFLHLLLATTSIYGAKVEDMAALCTIAASKFVGMRLLIPNKPQYSRFTIDMKEILFSVLHRNNLNGIGGQLRDLFREHHNSKLTDKIRTVLF